MNRAALRRDVAVIGLVGGGHFMSHFFQLSVAPLFPLIKADLDVGYAALGLIVTIFYATSGLSQTPAGFLVDRFGAPRVLLAGLSLVAVSIGLIGMVPNYWALLPLAALAGMGNSVFHPADYAILTSRVSEARLGQAYSVHSIGGTLGWAAAPAVLLPIAARWGWRRALLVATVLGLVAAATIAAQRARLATGGAHAEAAAHPRRAPALQLFLTPAILACFAYFILTSFSYVGVQTFMTTALTTLYDAPLTAATGALTAFLVATALGVLAGGRLADVTTRHDLVAAIGVSSGATLMLLVATAVLALPVVLVAVAAAGFAVGVTSPSRDMLVRAATPRGASGRVFGFVYSGLDVGSSTGPLLFGWLMDHGEARAVFVCVAVGFLLCAATVQVRMRAVPRPAL